MSHKRVATMALVKLITFASLIYLTISNPNSVATGKSGSLIAMLRIIYCWRTIKVIIVINLLSIWLLITSQ